MGDGLSKLEQTGECGIQRQVTDGESTGGCSRQVSLDNCERQMSDAETRQTPSCGLRRESTRSEQEVRPACGPYRQVTNPDEEEERPRTRSVVPCSGLDRLVTNGSEQSEEASRMTCGGFQQAAEGEVTVAKRLFFDWDDLVGGHDSSRLADTVIIFDWDDTLCCSSAVNYGPLPLANGSEIQCEPGQFQQLEAAIETVLTTAMALGDTYIVTNGAGQWVDESSRMWLPKTVPVLSRLKKIISARASYEHIWPGDPFAWKKAAFESILRDREAQGSSPGSSGGVNLVSLGDNLAEIDSAHKATSSIEGTSIIKTVKFKESPSVEEVLGELKLVTQLLPDLVNAESNSSNALVPRNNAGDDPKLAHLTSCAAGWRVVPHRRVGLVEEHLDTSSLSPLKTHDGPDTRMG